MGLRLSDYLPRASSTILLLPVLFFFILVRGAIFDVFEIIYYPFFLKPLPPLLAYCYIPQCPLAPSTTSRLTCFSGKLSLLKMFSKYFQEPPKMASKSHVLTNQSVGWSHCFISSMFFFFFSSYLLSWALSVKLLEEDWVLPKVHCPSGEYGWP